MKYIRENLEWRPLVGYEEDYEVSNYGDFKLLAKTYVNKGGRKVNRKEKIHWSEDLSKYGGTSNQSYLGFHPTKGKKTYAHRLTAITFIPNPLNKPEVNHKDGNTRNNYVGCAKNNYEDSNLEWVTHEENTAHAVENGLINHESELRKYACKKNREKVNYDAIKEPVIQLTKSGEFVAEFESIAEASRNTGVEKTNIGETCANKGYRKSAGGYVWVYKKNYDPNKNYTYSNNLSHCRKAVLQYDMEGNFIAEYESAVQAYKLNNWRVGDYIGECCRGKRKMYKNYKWKFKQD